MWLGRFALGQAYLEAGVFTEAYSEFEKCEKRKGEAMSIFLNDFPTYHCLDSLYYYMERAQEGLGNAAAKESYQKFLDIKAKADQGQALVEDARKRLSPPSIRPTMPMSSALPIGTSLPSYQKSGSLVLNYLNF
jgi:tetratricopeptide (TPR) repeat protein